MRILVVDDSEDSRDITEGALLSAGYKDVVTTGSAWETLQYLGAGKDPATVPVPVDIILLDIVMPEMDGIETCARIRSDGRYGDVPVIMVTSLADMDSLSNAFIAGANDYITKPINRIELLARVRAALKLKAELVRRQERERELLNFVSNWGDRRATLWIDEATGLFVGEVAEAYLTSAPNLPDDEPMSVITLAIDRLEMTRAARGEQAAHRISAKVAKVVRASVAHVGVVAASYRNGLIVMVAPGYDGAAANRLAETLRAAVSGLSIPNRESIAADHVTASIAVATARARYPTDRVKLLTQAISGVQSATAHGADRVIAMPA
ncbi:MAG TPA: response regulator [Pseudolabrys sp.]|nr:response regulator [Pseudolabrys sp.]